MSINRPYLSIDELPTTVRLFPLSGALLLPRGDLPLNIFEPRYIAMFDAALASDRLIGMIQPAVGGGATDALCDIGCAGRVTRFSETGDGRYLVTLSGVSRFRLLGEVDRGEPFRVAEVDFMPFAMDLTVGAGEEDVDRPLLVDMLRQFALASKLEVDWASIDAAPTETLVNALSMMSPFGAREKQSLLEASNLKTRAEILIGFAQFDIAQTSTSPYGDSRSQAH
jgi:Lon protease-like protein